MPRRYCHPTTAWRRLKELQEEGIWQKILQSLLEFGYSLGKIEPSLTAVDSTTIKAQKGGACRLGWPQEDKGHQIKLDRGFPRTWSASR